MTGEGAGWGLGSGLSPSVHHQSCGVEPQTLALASGYFSGDERYEAESSDLTLTDLCNTRLESHLGTASQGHRSDHLCTIP